MYETRALIEALGEFAVLNPLTSSHRRYEIIPFHN